MTDAEREFVASELRSLKSRVTAVRELVMRGEGVLLYSEWNEDRRTLHVNGDTAGLLYVASRLLELAGKDHPGAHEHLDEVSGLSSGSVAVVFNKEE